MKPRTQTEREAYRLSQRMKPIGERDTAHLIRNTYGTCAYNDMYNRCYAVINQSFYGWQVLRYFRIDRHRNRQRTVSYDVWEIMQIWSRVGHRQVLIARQRTMGLYIDTFIYSSKLEVRQHPAYVKTYNYYGITEISYTYIYDKSLTGAFRYADSYIDKSDCNSWYMFLSADKFAETVLKLRPELARYMMQRNRTASYYFKAVRIAIRHNYDITDYNLYFDMIQAMHRIGSDLSNPHFVCPTDLHHTHDWAMRAVAAEEERRREQKALRDSMTKEKAYSDRCAKYFNVVISDNLVSCHVLQSVKEFYDEATAMHNCVYTNKYYSKHDSLILSACIDGKRIETVEVDLKRMKVVQCFGACNKFTPYHDRIVNLVNSNINKIEQLDKQVKKIAI